MHFNFIMVHTRNTQRNANDQTPRNQALNFKKEKAKRPSQWVCSHTRTRYIVLLLRRFVDFLGLLVDRSALLDGNEALHLQCCASLVDCDYPALDVVVVLLGAIACCDTNDLTVFVLLQVRFLQSTRSLLARTTEHESLAHLARRDGLLLHGLLHDGLHGSLLHS